MLSGHLTTSSSSANAVLNKVRETKNNKVKVMITDHQMQLNYNIDQVGKGWLSKMIIWSLIKFQIDYIDKVEILLYSTHDAIWPK